MLIPQLTLYHYIVAAVILEDVIISKYRAVGGRYKVTTGEGKKDSEKEDVRGIEKRKIDVKDAHETDNAILKGLGYGWVAGFWMWSGSNLMFSLYGA